MADTSFDEMLARPRDNRLILQFSTAAPDWKYKHLPAFCKVWPVSMLFNKNWGSALIRRANHSPFSHVDMLMKDGTLVGASNSPYAPVIHGNPCGVASRPMDYQKFAYRRQMVLETDRAEDIRRMAVTQLGKEYDNGSLKDFMGDSFPGARNWRLTDSWFCSELATWAMEMGHFWGPERLTWPKNRVSPTDLLLMCIHDTRWLNRDTFWDPIPGLVLGEGEN